MYGKKGEKIVDANKTAVDRGIDSLVKVNIPEAGLMHQMKGQLKGTGLLLRKFNVLWKGMKVMTFQQVLL